MADRVKLTKDWAPTRPESESTKVEFRKSFAFVATLKDSPQAMNLPKSKDMNEALAPKKGAIGMADGIALDDASGKFKALKVDGKSLDMLSSGK